MPAKRSVSKNTARAKTPARDKGVPRERISNGARRYVKIAEAAEYVGVHPVTIRAMCRNGRLTLYKLGKTGESTSTKSIESWPPAV
jgi:excisionase family DNA binding protein